MADIPAISQRGTLSSDSAAFEAGAASSSVASINPPVAVQPIAPGGLRTAAMTRLACRPPGALRAVRQVRARLYESRLISGLFLTSWRNASSSRPVLGILTDVAAYIRRVLTRLTATAALAITVVGCVSISVPASSSPSVTAPQSTPTKGNPTPGATSTPSAHTPAPALATPSATAPLPTNSTTQPPASPSTQPSASTSGGRPVFSSVDEAYAQTVDWHSCAPNGLAAQCGTVYVPTSYEDPSLGTTAIAVAVYDTATNEIGHLLTDPGGPGAAGIDFAATVANNAPNLAAQLRLRRLRSARHGRERSARLPGHRGLRRAERLRSDSGRRCGTPAGNRA